MRKGKLTGVAKNDDFEEFLVADLLVCGLGEPLAPQVLYLRDAVVIAGCGFHVRDACLVEQNLVSVDLKSLADTSSSFSLLLLRLLKMVSVLHRHQAGVILLK